MGVVVWLPWAAKDPLDCRRRSSFLPPPEVRLQRHEPGSRKGGSLASCQTYCLTATVSSPKALPEVHPRNSREETDCLLGVFLTVLCFSALQERCNLGQRPLEAVPDPRQLRRTWAAISSCVGSFALWGCSWGERCRRCIWGSGAELAHLQKTHLAQPWAASSLLRWPSVGLATDTETFLCFTSLCQLGCV